MKLVDVNDNCIFEVAMEESVATMLLRAKANGVLNWPNAYIKDCDLSNFNFFGFNIEGIQFSNVNLHNANFARQNLKYADFHKCNLTHANFKSANLTSTYFNRCLLTGTQFNTSSRGAIFVGSIH